MIEPVSYTHLGPRKLTKDEELSNLDAAYKKTVDDFVTMETTNQHARRITVSYTHLDVYKRQRWL